MIKGLYLDPLNGIEPVQHLIGAEDYITDFSLSHLHKHLCLV